MEKDLYLKNKIYFLNSNSKTVYFLFGGCYNTRHLGGGPEPRPGKILIFRRFYHEKAE